MSDNDKTRSTSFAKTVDDLVQQENSLDRVAALSNRFNRAIEPPPPFQQEKARESDEKTIAHAPRPEMHLRPGGLARAVVDRQIDKKQLSAVAARALELNKDAKQRTAQAKTKSLSHEFQRHKHRMA